MEGFEKKNCDECMYTKWNCKPQISPIFHFECINEGWISGVLGVKEIMIFTIKSQKNAIHATAFFTPYQATI